MCIEEGRGIYRGEREGKRLESKFRPCLFLRFKSAFDKI